jgi:hypothetical protein
LLIAPAFEHFVTDNARLSRSATISCPIAPLALLNKICVFGLDCWPVPARNGRRAFTDLKSIALHRDTQDGGIYW